MDPDLLSNVSQLNITQTQSDVKKALTRDHVSFKRMSNGPLDNVIRVKLCSSANSNPPLD